MFRILATWTNTCILCWSANYKKPQKRTYDIYVWVDASRKFQQLHVYVDHMIVNVLGPHLTGR